MVTDNVIIWTKKICILKITFQFLYIISAKSQSKFASDNLTVVGNQPSIVTFRVLFYIASPMSEQAELNPVLWLATQAGKMALSCLLRIICCMSQENSVLFPYNKSFLHQAC